MRMYLKTSEQEIVYVECVFKEERKVDDAVCGKLCPYELVVINGKQVSSVRIEAAMINAISHIFNDDYKFPVDEWTE